MTHETGWHETGWAEPAKVISAPRIQMVDGFTYLYFEDKNKLDREVGSSVGALIPKVEETYRQMFAGAKTPPLLFFFNDVGQAEDGAYIYDVQIGVPVSPGTQPACGALVRDVPAALIAAMLVWGELNSVYQTYGPLCEFIETSGYECVVGWREYYLYMESDRSGNNITWVQHEVKPN